MVFSPEIHHVLYVLVLLQDCRLKQKCISRQFSDSSYYYYLFIYHSLETKLKLLNYHRLHGDVICMDELPNNTIKHIFP